MKERQDYDVRVRIVATISVRVFARTPEEAESIAEEVVHDDALDGLEITSETIEDVTVDDVTPVDGVSSDEVYRTL